MNMVPAGGNYKGALVTILADALPQALSCGECGVGATHET